MRSSLRAICFSAITLVVTATVVVGESNAGEGSGALSSRGMRTEQLRDMNALYASPWTVNPGHAQIETYAIQYARDHDRGRTSDNVRETWTIGPMTVKAGLLKNLDVEFTFTPFARVRSTDRLTRTTTVQQGFGDVYAAIKYNFSGNDGGSLALAGLPFLKFPSSQDDLGNDFVEGGLAIPIATDLLHGWWLILSPEASLNHDLFSSGYHVDFANTVYVCHSIVGKLSGYADLYTWISTEKHTRPVCIVDFGLSYGWSQNIQIDAGVSLALTKWGDDVNPYLGLSFRF